MDFAQARTAMVDSQVRPNDVTKYSIIAALQKVERENFVPESMRMVAYADSPIALDTGRVILDARVFSKMLDALNILPTDFVLDIGCGLGYSTAVIASLSEAVIGVEDDATRVTDATENLMAAQVDNAVILEGELAKGAAKHGPYDVVIMEGAVEQVPANLIKQIKDGGRMAAIFNKMVSVLYVSASKMVTESAGVIRLMQMLPFYPASNRTRVSLLTNVNFRNQ